LTKILLDLPAPHVTAQAWAVYDMKANKLLFGKLERDRREIASLTKIMTCYTVIQLLKKFDIDETTTMVLISENASDIPGTSAEL
jgi:D-alanyl-D-alanine carboxypeptidase